MGFLSHGTPLVSSSHHGWPWLSIGLPMVTTGDLCSGFISSRCLTRNLQITSCDSCTTRLLEPCQRNQLEILGRFVFWIGGGKPRVMSISMFLFEQLYIRPTHSWEEKHHWPCLFLDVSYQIWWPFQQPNSWLDQFCGHFHSLRCNPNGLI